MKKLIAILVVFALVAGAAFAQANFAAGGATRATLFQGHSEDGGDPYTNFESWFWMAGDKTNDDGNMGAKGSISINMSNVDSPTKEGWREAGTSLNQSGDDTWFYAWWQPIDQLFIKMGKVGEDGKYWTGADICAWGYQSNDLMVNPEFNYYNGHGGNVMGEGVGFFDNKISNYWGLQVSVIPMEMFHLNLGWNMKNFGGEDAIIDAYGSIAVQAVVNLDIGEAAIGFRNEMAGGESTGMQIAGQWKMPIGDAMKIEAGVRLDMNKDANDDYVMDPLQVGVGFGYGSPWGDDFWLTVRVAAEIPMEDGDDTAIGFGICPSYDLGIFRVYCPIDIGIHMPDVGDTAIGWGVNPYIRKQLGGLEVWAGLALFNGAGGNDTKVSEANSDQVNYKVQMAFLWAW